MIGAAGGMTSLGPIAISCVACAAVNVAGPETSTSVARAIPGGLTGLISMSAVSEMIS